MRRLLPHPVLTIGLTVFWLILQQRITPGQIALGLLVGVATGVVTRNLDLEKPVLRRPWLLPVLIGLVMFDIARSNVAVAWIALTHGRGSLRSGFLRVPIRTRDRTVQAFLAMILTATPGTVWIEFDEGTGELLLHVLDLVDEAHWVDIISNRYEKRLMEIFE